MSTAMTKQEWLAWITKAWDEAQKRNWEPEMADKEYVAGWNAALDEAAARIGEIAAFPKTTQDSFAVFIKGLKR